MRFSAAVLTLLVTLNTAWALSCAAPRAVFWPASGEVVPEAPQIVLVTEGYNVLESAWLEGSEKVELTIETHPEFQILKPKKPLQAGQSYTLAGTGKGQFSDGVKVWAGKKQVPVSWRVEKASYAPATWNAPVKLGKGSAQNGGWGITSTQEMTFDYAHSGPVMAEVVMTRGGKSQTFMMAAKKAFRIGRGLCGGELGLQGEGEWIANITLVAPDGTRSEAQTVKFPSPATPMILGR